MNTDRELLEKAAKAAGYELWWGITDAMIRCLEPEHPDKTHNLWNPLTDDGDALRLAVRLKLRIDYVGDQACVNGVMAPGMTAEEACRKAIVRAAAALAEAAS